MTSKQLTLLDCANDIRYSRMNSSLQRLKNYLRSTLSQKRLNINVVLMHTHKECADKVNLLSIAKDSVTSNERCANYFGHY